jgi:hypothetical protein
VIEPVAPLTPGLGTALRAGRRRARRAPVTPPLSPAEMTGELEALTQAVEEVFTDLSPTGELVRPYVDRLDGCQDQVWTGLGVVPPPTPVFGVSRVESDGRPIAAPPATRRAAREQRRPLVSARTVAARNLAKGSVLAVTMFGVVASNLPQEIHERLFNRAGSLEWGSVPASVELSLAPAATARPSDAVDELLRRRLVKQQQVQTVSEAGQRAGGVVLAAAKAQAAADAATAREALERAAREAQRNPKALPEPAVAEGEQLALERPQPEFGRLWDPPGPAGLQDGLGRLGLADQPRHPDRVGPGLHRRPLRHAVCRVGPQ